MGTVHVGFGFGRSSMLGEGAGVQHSMGRGGRRPAHARSLPVPDAELRLRPSPSDATLDIQGKIRKEPRVYESDGLRMPQALCLSIRLSRQRTRWA